MSSLHREPTIRDASDDESEGDAQDVHHGHSHDHDGPDHGHSHAPPPRPAPASSSSSTSSKVAAAMKKSGAKATSRDDDDDDASSSASSTSSSASDSDSDSDSSSSAAADSKNKTKAGSAAHRDAKQARTRLPTKMSKQPRVEGSGPGRIFWIALAVIVVAMVALRFFEESYDFNYDEFMELYHALELTPSADLTIDQIKRAHHQLAKKWHPDKCSGDKNECDVRYTKILHAYDTLKDRHVAFWEHQAKAKEQSGNRNAPTPQEEDEEEQRQPKRKTKPRNN